MGERTQLTSGLWKKWCLDSVLNVHVEECERVTYGYKYYVQVRFVKAIVTCQNLDQHRANDGLKKGSRKIWRKKKFYGVGIKIEEQKDF